MTQSTRMDWPTGYRVVVVDPPWPIRMGRTTTLQRNAKPGRWARELPYRTMPLEEIRALPMRTICMPAAWVMLWCPASLVETAASVMRGWTARGPTGWLVWHKTNGGPQMPGRWRQNAEFVVVGSIGSPRWTTIAGWDAVHSAPRPRLEDHDPAAFRDYARKCLANGASCPPPRFIHSAKPDSWFAEIAAHTFGPRLEMFARQVRPGWDAWGDEAPTQSTRMDSRP